MKDIYSPRDNLRICSNPSCTNVLTGTIRQKFCSLSCKNHLREKTVTFGNCVICGTKFQKKGKLKTCSPECSQENHIRYEKSRSEDVGKLYLDLCYRFQECETSQEQKQYIERLLETGVEDTKIRQALLATEIHKKLTVKNMTLEGLVPQSQNLTQKDVGNQQICILTIFKDKTFDVSFISWTDYRDSFLKEYETVDTKTVVGLFYEQDQDLVRKLEELATLRDKRLEVLIDMGILTMSLKQAERLLRKSKLNLNLVLVMSNHVFRKTGNSSINAYFQEARGRK